MLDPETFKARLRLEVLERLVLLTAFQSPLAVGHLTAEQSQALLNDWLDTNCANIDRELGAHFGEPAQTALYSEEAQDLAKRMKAIVEKFAAVAKRNGL